MKMSSHQDAKAAIESLHGSQTMPVSFGNTDEFHEVLGLVAAASKRFYDNY